MPILGPAANMSEPLGGPDRVYQNVYTDKIGLRELKVDDVSSKTEASAISQGVVNNALNGVASNKLPLMNGVASAGISSELVRDDHVHPTDTTRAPSYALTVGEMRLFPFRIAELPARWYFTNGGGYSTTSPQGQALASLSDNFKADWGITVSGGTIYLPNLFLGADGYFLRPVNGSARLPGTRQGDAIRNIPGSISLGNSMFSSATGAFLANSLSKYGASGQDYDGFYGVTFDPSRVVATAAENRPINAGMTPAIYLGV